MLTRLALTIFLVISSLTSVAAYDCTQTCDDPSSIVRPAHVVTATRRCEKGRARRSGALQAQEMV